MRDRSKRLRTGAVWLVIRSRSPSCSHSSRSGHPGWGRIAVSNSPPGTLHQGASVIAAHTHDRAVAEPGHRRRTRRVHRLAPAGAEKSLPDVGVLVISFDYFCCPGKTLNIYSDGRMIWTQYNIVGPGEGGSFPLAPQGADEWETGYLEQRLTPKGVELLRSELISSGLFEANHSFVKKTIELGIVVRRGERVVSLKASTADDPFGATQEQAREIERLTEIFKAPAAWLPYDAWADPTIRAFVPSRYVFTIHFYSNGGRSPDDPSDLPPPADELLRSADVVTNSSSCQVVTAAEARRIHVEIREAFGDLSIPVGFMERR